MSDINNIKGTCPNIVYAEIMSAMVKIFYLMIRLALFNVSAFCTRKMVYILLLWKMKNLYESESDIIEVNPGKPNLV